MKKAVADNYDELIGRIDSLEKWSDAKLSFESAKSDSVRCRKITVVGQCRTTGRHRRGSGNKFGYFTAADS